MQLLTKETDYAIRSLLHVAAAPGGATTAAAIAREEGISWLFLRRVMQKLAAGGLLVSQKGRTGGFSLARSPAKITMIEVIKVFQGKVELTQCLVRGTPCCNRPGCEVRRKLKQIEGNLRRELGDITIEMLARRKHESR